MKQSYEYCPINTDIQNNTLNSILIDAGNTHFKQWQKSRRHTVDELESKGVFMSFNHFNSDGSNNSILPPIEPSIANAMSNLSSSRTHTTTCTSRWWMKMIYSSLIRTKSYPNRSSTSLSSYCTQTRRIIRTILSKQWYRRAGHKRKWYECRKWVTPQTSILSLKAGAEQQTNGAKRHGYVTVRNGE